MKIKNNKKYQILTPDGFKSFDGIRVLKNKTIKIKTDNNIIGVTPDHPFVVNNKILKAVTLRRNETLQTKNGYEKILYKRKSNKIIPVYDLLNVDGGNVYYTNDILSHNCFIETGETAIDKEVISEFRNISRLPDILNTSEYKVWEKPDPKSIYIMGIDVSDGVGGAASCIQGLNITDLTNIKQAFTYWNKFIDTAHFAKEIFNIAKQWGKPHILIERNAMGGEVVNFLKHQPCNYERLVGYSEGQQINYEKSGIYSSTNVKYEGISNLRYWINSLKCVQIYDIATIQELDTFVKFPNGTWHKQPGEGLLDDRVMALTWALFGLNTAIAENIFEIVQYDENGKPLKIKKSYYDDDEFSYGLNQYKKDWGDEDFVPAFISTKNSNTSNPEMDDLMADGWTTLSNF